MKKNISRVLAGFLVFCMAGGPAWTTIAQAQTTDNLASDDEVQEIQHLAQAGYLGGSKTIDPSAKSLTEDQVTDALLAMENVVRAVDLTTLKPGDPRYSLSDLQTLLQLEQDYSELIRDRKVSSWLYEKRLNKMIAALTPAAGDSSSPVSPTPTTTAFTSTPGVLTPTPTPSFSVGEDDWNHLKDSLQQLTQKSNDLQIKYDQKLQDFDTNEQELKTRNQEVEDEMKLVKNLMDTYESNLQKLNDRLDQVSQKANEKTLTDEELNEELTNMEKDLRDNTQDLTVLKQDVALLKSPEKPEQSPLDDFLTSKWLAGGALLVGLAALTVAITKK